MKRLAFSISCASLATSSLFLCGCGLLKPIGGLGKAILGVPAGLINGDQSSVTPETRATFPGEEPPSRFEPVPLDDREEDDGAKGAASVIVPLPLTR